jgi:hypothetical protein
MTMQMAMELLGLNPSDDKETIREQIELLLFDFKKEILSKYMVPTLLRKKQEPLNTLIHAESLAAPLSLEEACEEKPKEWNSLPANRIEFLENYEQHLSELKLQLTQTNSFAALKPIMNALILAQEYYMALFKMLFNEYAEALPEEVNSREMIDTGKLLQALKSGPIDNKIAWAIERELTRIDRISRLTV